ncbi:MAG: hypothetical protein WCG93_08260 [Paludibacter sp.]
MANLFEHKDRWLVPNWRSFGKTTILGELDSFQSFREPTSKTDINEYIIDWRLNQTAIHAADLLSAAIVNNKKENKHVYEAANFIISNKDKATLSQISLASLILDKTNDVDLFARFKKVSFDNLPSFMNPEPIRFKIKEAKLMLITFPSNPILYVELSRYYSILGQEQNSIKSMRTALHLAPNNRFVLRCATRLFAHYKTDYNDYLEYIHEILRKSTMTAFDPWLTSAEISIANLQNRSSKFIKRGIELINSNNISPFNFTELASSIGTVELLYGSTKKSREYFKKSLLNPNDNSLAQIEWASSKDNQLNISPTKFEVKMNFEALALDNYHNKEYELALENAAKWFIDMPFSKRPVMFGSNISSIILNDQSKAISFLNAGLISNPNDPQLINNLAYALALNDKSSEAFEQLNKIRNIDEVDEITSICIAATRGLAFFRNNNFEDGRQMYLKAIEHTTVIKNKELNWIAILNYAREEIKIGSIFVDSIMEKVAKIPVDNIDIEIQILRNEVAIGYEKLKQQSI